MSSQEEVADDQLAKLMRAYDYLVTGEEIRVTGALRSSLAELVAYAIKLRRATVVAVASVNAESSDQPRVEVAQVDDLTPVVLPLASTLLAGRPAMTLGEDER